MRYSEYIKITPTVLLESMQKKVNTIAYYAGLQQIATNTEDKDIINRIQSDEEVHYSLLADLYQQLTGTNIPEIHPSTSEKLSFKDEIKHAYLEELASSEFFRRNRSSMR
ncbi:MAG: hypothetical protein FWC79_04455 [Oscillospiraceae bacterium]|nr:hypothetical protein [Oscillospiraceae bacterium]